jgi:hypothetical protein
VAFVGKLLRRQRHTGFVAALPGRVSRTNYLDVTAWLWLVAQVALTLYFLSTLLPTSLCPCS